MREVEGQETKAWTPLRSLFLIPRHGPREIRRVRYPRVSRPRRESASGAGRPGGVCAGAVAADGHWEVGSRVQVLQEAVAADEVLPGEEYRYVVAVET